MEIFCNIQYKNTQYSKSNDPRAETINTVDMCDYYGREEACDKTIDTYDAINYYKYRIGSNGGWGKNGDFKADEDKKMFEKYKPETIYRMVVSFDKSFAEDNRILDKKGMKKLISKSMEKNIRELGLDPDNVEWGCYYHTNTKNPHIHAYIFEKTPTKTDYFIPPDTFKPIKSNIIRTMHINSELYIERDNVKKEIIDVLKNMGLDTTKYSNSNNSKKLFTKDKEIDKMFKKLEKIIPKTGSMKYNSANIMPYRPEVDKLVDKLLEKDDVKKLYKKYKEMLEKEKEMFDNRYYSKEESKAKNKSIENKEKELHDRIANMILQNIKCYREDVEEYEQEEEDELYTEDSPKTVSKLSKASMKNRSRCLEAGVLDELAKELAQAHYDLKEQEKMLNNMIEKAKAQSKNLEFVHGG